ncbi:hypothetical protein BD779DRAFT_1522106 [Infundibulicybe gibba]|nr:hypothetical protein BD779DRAFT_1522106 [Infundibulicybe gibba]
MPCPDCTRSSRLAGPPALPKSIISTPPLNLDTTNRNPTSSEVTYLKDIIERAQEAFLIADEGSKQIKSVLDGWLEQRAQLLRIIEGHKTILSPLRRLPPEVLGEIFIAYLGVGGMFAPILLSHLCSRWRIIVLDTPRLWSKLNVTITSSNVSRMRSALEVYLARSGQALLDITIQHQHYLSNLLAPQAHRWEHINLNIPPDLHLELIPLLKDRLQSLKSITLVRKRRHYIRLEEYEDARLIDCYIEAPKITDVSVIGVYHLPLPWTQLGNLKTPVALDKCHNMLRTAEGLTNWTVELLPPTDISHPPSASFQHSRLTSLRVDFLYESAAGQVGFFFSVLTLPSLQSFFLDTNANPGLLDGEMHVESQRSIVSFFRRSSPPLVTFHISLGMIPDSDDFFVNCLQCTPKLVDLQIDIGYSNKTMITDQFMRRLNAKYPNFILPNLERLSLIGCMRFTSKPIAAMVASRMPAATSLTGSVAILQRLSLDLVRVHKSSPMEALRPFISDGLHLQCRVTGDRTGPPLSHLGCPM